MGVAMTTSSTARDPEPHWENPPLRNHREDDVNVGDRSRSAHAIVLPDPPKTEKTMGSATQLKIGTINASMIWACRQQFRR